MKMPPTQAHIFEYLNILVPGILTEKIRACALLEDLYPWGWYNFDGSKAPASASSISIPMCNLKVRCGP